MTRKLGQIIAVRENTWMIRIPYAYSLARILSDLYVVDGPKENDRSEEMHWSDYRGHFEEAR
jgi:hypothetical protein